jgi:hypothetical protein
MALTEVLNQPRAGAEEHGDEMHVNLIDAAAPQQLLADAGAEHADVLAVGGGLCQLNCFNGLPANVYTLPSGTCPACCGRR